MAKKIYIETWYPRDEHIFNAFATCGILQKKDMLEYVKNKRIDNYVRDNYIEKCKDIKTNETYYKLTEKGRELCRERYDREPTNFHSYKHESRLRDLYFELDKDTRLEQMSEPELRIAIKEDIEYRKQSDDYDVRQYAHKLEEDYRNSKISVVDFGILRFNEETREVERAEFFEAITKNYKDEEIQAKFNLASVYNASLTTSCE